MKISSHTLVKNEARFVWYAVMSVIDHVDRLLLWDDGSTDGTRKILKEIKSRYPQKVSLQLNKAMSGASEFAAVRQKMLDQTNADWFLMLDADEIWWESGIKHLIGTIKEKGNEFESIVVPTINLVGDMYHYQEEKAGNYRLAGRVGHYNLRVVNRSIPGLKSDKPHGRWGWADEKGRQIQNRNQQKIKFLKTPYLHTSFLHRSRTVSGDAEVIKRAKKLKYEIGESFSLDYYYPEVFFRPKPSFIPNIWQTMSTEFKNKATWQTPLRKVKRRLLPASIGY